MLSILMHANRASEHISFGIRTRASDALLSMELGMDSARAVLQPLFENISLIMCNVEGRTKRSRTKKN